MGSGEQLLRGLAEAWEVRRDGFRPEPVITILPEPAVARVPEIEVVNTRVSEIQAVAEMSRSFGMPFESISPTSQLFIEIPTSVQNRSVECAYATMVSATGRATALDSVVSKFAALNGTMDPLDAFAALATEHGIGTKLTTPITGATLLEIVRGEVAIVMTLEPDDGADSQTVLVVGARQRTGQGLDFLVANSFSTFTIAGKTEELNPNLVWARATDLAIQATAGDPSVKTIEVYQLNKV
jgi:hypothetical protein